MDLPVDERLMNAQYYLIEQRKTIREQQRKLYERFRTYALNKLKTQGQPFEVKFRSIDGDPGLKYKEVDMGDEFHLVYGGFMFDPKTNLITNYVRYEFSGTKTEEDVNELINKTTDKLQQFRKFQQTLEHATELEQIKINKKIQQKVDRILEGIFNGKLNFSDQEFKELVEMNIELENALQELNIRIEAVSVINGSSEPYMIESDDRGKETTSKDNRQIFGFLNGDWGKDVDPTFTLLALGQQDGIKTM